MSWVPLAGAGVGSVLGGVLSDWSTWCHVKSNAWWGQVCIMRHARALPRTENRAILAAVSCLLSGPFIVMSVRAGFPDCFLYMAVSGFLGEMYIGVTITVVSDLCPPKMLVLCVAVVSLLTTLIAASVQLLIPLLKGSRISLLCISSLADTNTCHTVSNR